MQVHSFDFGGSTVDVALWKERRLISCNAFERQDLPLESLESFLTWYAPSFPSIKEFCITGGKSHSYSSVVQGVPVRHVDEIRSIGLGGMWLWARATRSNFDPCDRAVTDCEGLVVSLGTGTCMVSVRGGEVSHVGGTGVGGGTFMGLCHLLLQEKDPERLVALFKRGNARQVDVSVGEIVGRGIGRVSAEHTASNLGKIGFPNEIEFEREDLAAGIVNLIAQSIAIPAVFAARAEGLDSLILTGKLTRIQPLLDIVCGVADWYGLKTTIPEGAEHVGAIGAALRLVGEG